MSVFCPGNHTGHIQQIQPLALELLRYTTGCDILCHALDDGRLSHARLADQRRVILMFAGEDLQNGLDLPLPPDDQFRLVRALNQVHTELIKNP